MSSDSKRHDEHSHEGHTHEEHVHEAGDHELTECPACGAPIRGADDMKRGETIPEITTMEKRHVMVGRRTNDLWMCKGCGATLGVRRRRD
ncbi:MULTISPECIES: hypothetical protein [Haloferax]|uniref:Small CPxCG-related zinc finger protein n=1 Tax=Haloferax marinum TaxID=2666143 RepID=A0A6A8G3L7_9EURY|nr:MULTISPECIES: hypothetical protein [Haloferax]KAB1196161.1 hypothetical protein Hfx1150_01005 [Haloferax sp. CBA1150]MRW95148.1 hypothetical protein [Haloferax marinum]